MKLITHLTLIFFLTLSCLLIHNYNRILEFKLEDILCFLNYRNGQIIYDSPKVFQIQDRMPETDTFTVLSPSCMFKGNYTERDCKSYTNMFLDLKCTLHQEKKIFDCHKNPGYYFYLSSKVYNRYDARLNICDDIAYTKVRLSPGLYCQSNNVCLYAVSFTLSYKDWDKVPFEGNNVTLNCSQFTIYATPGL
jgi:hypothetical protein